MKTLFQRLHNAMARMLGFDREMARLKRKFEELLWDPNFGVHSRAGFDELIKNFDAQYRSAAFIDFDGVRELNKKYGYEAVNRRIKATLKELSESADVFVARWFSGDEIVVLSRHDVQETEKLMAAASLKGRLLHDAPFTCQVEQWDGAMPLNAFIDSLSHKVLALKKEKALRSKESQMSGLHLNGFDAEFENIL
jgi:GGDEF domain-containing protein